MREIHEYILHCSATEEGKQFDVDDIRRWHLDRGWSDVGYHYVILQDGTIQLGRPLELVGAHCKGRNKNSVGICYIGGLRDREPADTMTWSQFYAVYRLVTSLNIVLGKRVPLRGHNEFSEKACPSFLVQDKFSFLYQI